MWISDKLDSTFATDSRLVRGSSVKYVPRKGQYFRNELGALESTNEILFESRELL